MLRSIICLVLLAFIQTSSAIDINDMPDWLRNGPDCRVNGKKYRAVTVFKAVDHRNPTATEKILCRDGSVKMVTTERITKFECGIRGLRIISDSERGAVIGQFPCERETNNEFSFEQSNMGELEKFRDKGYEPGRYGNYLTSQYKSKKRCRAKGTRIPTARELALLGEQMGANGIRESSHRGLVVDHPLVLAERKKMKELGLEPIVIKSRNSYDLLIDFYYDHRGAKAKTLEQERSYWGPDTAYGYGYMFNGKNHGKFEVKDDRLGGATRCAIVD